MHCEIIDRYFNEFFVEIQKENLKSLFWAPELWRPNRYTGPPNGLNKVGAVTHKVPQTENSNLLENLVITFIRLQRNV